MAKERESIRQFPLSPLPALTVTRASSWRRQLLVSLFFVVVVAAASHLVGLALVPVLVGSTVTALLLLVWRLHSEKTGPTIAEARLMALTARIRPHFLFNSLNAILGTIRSDPRRAELALEELSDLFRALLQDPKELVPLSEELALCRQYLSLERLRLGDRVQVRWDIDRCPADALMPPLVLQPLLENAVYHGIEPMAEAGCIDIRLFSEGDLLLIELSNPSSPLHGHEAGNRMALDNIRERLALFYGDHASVHCTPLGDRFVVRLILPYRQTRLGLPA